MATANYSTIYEHRKTMTDFLCSSELTDGIHGELRWAAAINIFLSVTALIGNATFLVALKKVSSLQPPSKLLFRTLATTDLCVGIISQPLTAVALMPEVKQHIHVCRYASTIRFLTGYPLCMVSMLTSTAINLERLFALYSRLRLRYRRFVTLKRTYVAVTFFWVVSLVFTAMSLVSDIIITWYGFIVLFSCLAISAFSYGKIFLVLCRNQNQVDCRAFWQRQPKQTTPLNAVLYKKTVYTVLWVQLALAVCYTPYFVTAVVLSRRFREPSVWLLVLWRYVGTLLYFNSSLNPVLYCWKMRSVKKAMKETIQQICSSRACT
ncbi:adenosine receptor A3-like [Montipora foliosa]|uniref:adenosine receptor A3-like n=1 Tax=Montipora foliosa TaxID=591990 RepID=UPI0035F1DF83